MHVGIDPGAHDRSRTSSIISFLDHVPGSRSRITTRFTFSITFPDHVLPPDAAMTLGAETYYVCSIVD
jgi:hypothetical protein